MRTLDREQVRVESHISVVQARERIGDSNQILTVECPQPECPGGAACNGGREWSDVGGLQLPDLLLQLNRFSEVFYRIQFTDGKFRVSGRDTHSRVWPSNIRDSQS